MAVAVAALTVLHAVSERLLLAAAERYAPAPELRLTGRACHALYGYPRELLTCYQRDARSGPLIVDSRGFFWYDHAEDVSAPRPAGLVRVAQLGGSTSAGVYYRILGEALAGHPAAGTSAPVRTRYQVIPAAVHGYRSADERVRYFHDVVATDPSAIAIYSGWNDLGDLFDDREDAVIDRYLEDGDAAALAALGPWFGDHLDYFHDQRDQRLAEKRTPPFELPGALPAHAATQAVGTFLIDRDPVARGLHVFAHRDEVVVVPSEQRVDEPSPFDEAFVPSELEANLMAVAEHAAQHGIRVILEVPAQAFGCFPARITRSRSGIILSVSDRHAFMTKTLPAVLERIAARTGATLVDHRRVFDALPAAEKCRLFAAEAPNAPVLGDELHMNETGLRVRARAVARALGAADRELVRAAHPGGAS